jgi:hypothetical protein
MKPTRRCQCKKGGCITGDGRCKCVDCHSGCSCGDRCTKTKGLSKKEVTTKFEIKEAQLVPKSLKTTQVENEKILIDELYLFLDTEGGKVNDLHDVYIVLKYGIDREGKVVYFGMDEDISLKDNFDKIDYFLANIKEKYDSKVINLIAWNMDGHDKGIIRKWISTSGIVYLDALKWCRWLMDTTGYKLQEFGHYMGLDIFKNSKTLVAHTAKYDTVLMVDCLCLSILCYFDNYLGEDNGDKLLKAYCSEDVSTILDLERECFEFLNTKVSLVVKDKVLRSRTVENERMMTLNQYFTAHLNYE